MINFSIVTTVLHFINSLTREFKTGKVDFLQNVGCFYDSFHSDLSVCGGMFAIGDKVF